ncbi:MAG: replicative DNA helicase [Pseudomonadota bacterium]
MDEQPALPHSIDAERAVLGALLLAPNLVDIVTEVVDASMFYREAHRRLFELLLQMHDARQAIEPLTVVDRVLASGEEQAFGGAAYVASLPEQVPTFENVEYYAKMVQEKAVRRRLLEVAQRIGHDVHVEADLSALLDVAESAVLGVSQQRGGQDWFSFNEIAGDEWKRILALAEHQGEVTGITTGFIDLDRKLSGFHESELIVLAARPAMGKTALALNLARHAAVEGGKPVGIFSLEMPRGQLVVRMLCAEGKIEAHRVRTGTLRRDVDWPQLADAMELLNQAPIFIDDSPGLTVAQVRSRARRLQAQHGGLGLIVIDYLQLMQGSGGPRESREQAISGISRGLKGLAKELKVPVLSLAQLNRGVELRPDKRPMMSDLRESGAIEQDADLVLFIYRDEYYKKEESEHKGVAQIIIGKNRHGPTGDVELAFNGAFLRFDDLDRRPGAPDYL